MDRRMGITRHRLFVAVIGVLALASVASGVSAAERTRPFHFDATIALDFPDVAVSGQATHLGLVIGRGVVVAPGEVAVTLQAANGALVELFARYADDGKGGWVGTYEITGGTGRFAGATGSGALAAVLNPDGTFAATAEGTITY